MTVLSAIPQNLWMGAAVLMAALSLGAIYGFGPVDHVNKPFTPQERRQYRRQSLLWEQLALAVSLGMVSASLSVIAGSQEVKRNVQANGS